MAFLQPVVAQAFLAAGDARRRLLVLTLAVAAIAGGFRSMALAADADSTAGKSSIVAVVNADPISRDQLSQATLDRYGNDVLENMINRHLILQQCKQQGITITSEDVRAEITRIAKKFGLDVPSYLQLLQEERDISPNQYSNEIIWPLLALRRLVADQIEVTKEEYDRAYLSQFGEAVKCRMIMVDKQSLADRLHRQASADPDAFARLAKEHSQDETSASVGGLIPPIRRHMGDSRIEETVFGLSDNQVSSVLQIADQFMIFQAVRHMPATQPSPKAMPAIREQITDRIRDEKMQGTANNLFADLQRRAKVVTILGDEAKMQQHPGVAAIINGQQISIAAVARECVKRHGAEVLDGEIHRKLLTQALNKAGKSVHPSDLDAEVAQAAISYGYVRSDGTADVTAWMESVLSDGETTREIYLRDAVWPSVALKKLVEDSVEVSESDMRQGFQSAYGPRAEVLAVVLSDQRTAQKVWEMARDNPTEKFFGELAKQYSIEPTSSSNWGKVPPLRKFGGQPALEKEAFAMKPGDLSGIVATGDKYIVMRCQGFTEPVVEEMSVVREELRRDLLEKKRSLAMGKRFDQLKGQAEIDNYFTAARDLPRMAERPQR